MESKEISFELITDKIEGKETKRKVIFLNGLKKAVIYYLTENPEISLKEFSERFIETNQNDREYIDFLYNINLEEKDFSEINDKLKEISQRVSNSQQSIRMQREKLDKLYGKIILESEETKKKVDSVWEQITQLNDRIRILEKGKSLI